MDVNVTRLGGTLIDEEKRTLQWENKCFYCKIKGHVSKNCRKKVANKATASRQSTVATWTIMEEAKETMDKDHITWFQSRSWSKKLDLNDMIFAEEMEPTEMDF